MSTIDNTPCPTCRASGTLSLSEALVAKPYGSFSIAGAQMKTVATACPVVTCSACGLRKVGRYEGRHAVFSPNE